jgi:tetratricopeptide (TPR) repeat protein
LNAASSVTKTAGRSAVTVLVVTIWILCAREYQAHWVAVRGDEAGLREAVQTDPHDALHRYWYGRYLLIERHQPQEAIAQFQAGLDANPHVADMWFNLALAQLVMGRTAEVRDSLQRGIDSEPYNTQSLLSAANGYLVAGETGVALGWFHKVVEADPSQADAVLDQTWRSTRDLNSVLGKALPDSPEVRTRLFRYLAQNEDWTAAEELWPWLATQGDAPEASVVQSFLRHLMQRDPAAAAAAWAQAQHMVVGWNHYTEPGNLISNPGFESPVSGVPFDWRLDGAPGVTASLDTSSVHGGSQSLRLDANATNLAALGPSQLILVEPGKTYELTYYVATSSLLSASPPMITIEDAAGSLRLAASPEFPEKTPWVQHSLRFSIPAGVSVVALRLGRSTPETRIKGTLWLDDFHLAEVRP